jgi:hypothetical protein
VDPGTALIFSIIVARVIIAAWEASRAHAAWEAHSAREQVTRAVRRRHRRLVAAMDAGRASGPWSPWWWGYQGVVIIRYSIVVARWGAVMAARTVRAGWRGGRLAWHLAHQYPRPRWAGRVHVGVCRGCGWVVAATALDPDTRTCPACQAGQSRRAPTAGQPAPPEPEPESQAEPEIVDAEIVEDSGQQEHPGRPCVPAEPPATSGGDPELPASPMPVPALESGGSQMDTTTTPSGEVHTHGAWNQSSAAMQHILDGLSSGLDAMLGSLTAQNAGRDQVTGVTAWADKVASCISHGQAHIADTNARQDPVVDAVGVAGGPEQTADMNYYAEV